MNEKDRQIICRLRNNSRENLTKMSRATRIPVSTLYDKIKKYSDNVIDRHTVLLNYKKIGYTIRVKMLIKVPPDSIEIFQRYLKSNNHVNNLQKINNGYDMMAEALFRNMEEFNKFRDNLNTFKINQMQEFFILEDLKREGFLTDNLMVSAG